MIRETACFIIALIITSITQVPCFSEGDAELKNQQNRPKIGLALGGGGTRGAAHLGVLRVLERERIPIDFICGTSMGSVVGGLYAAGVPISKIEEMMLSKSMGRAYFRMPIPLRVVMYPLDLLPRGLGKHGLIGFGQGDCFARYIDKSLPESCKNIQSTMIPFSAVATDLISGQPFVIKNGEIAKAIQASSAVPFLKRPVRIDGRILNDGFICGSNLPVDECKSMGAEFVICVNVDGILEKVPVETLHHNRPFRHRISTIILSNLDAAKAKKADVLICPDVSGVGLMTKRRSEMEKAIAAGERAATDALPQIREFVGKHNSMHASMPAPNL